MTNACTPSGIVPTVDNPCEMLGALRAALYQLMAGQAKAVVRNNDQWIEFQRGDAALLKQEVRRLEIICGAGGGRARAARAVGPFPVHAHRNRGLI